MVAEKSQRAILVNITYNDHEDQLGKDFVIGLQVESVECLKEISRRLRCALVAIDNRWFFAMPNSSAAARATRSMRRIRLPPE